MSGAPRPLFVLTVLLAAGCAACASGEKCTPGEPLECSRRLDLSGQWTGEDGLGNLRVSGTGSSQRVTWFREGPLPGEQQWVTIIRTREARSKAVSELLFEGNEGGGIETGSRFFFAQDQNAPFGCWPGELRQSNCRLSYRLVLNGRVGDSELAGWVELHQGRNYWIGPTEESMVWSAPVRFTRNQPVVAPLPCGVCPESGCTSFFGCSGSRSPSSSGSFSSSGDSSWSSSSSATTAASSAGSTGSSNQGLSSGASGAVTSGGSSSPSSSAASAASSGSSGGASSSNNAATSGAASASAASGGLSSGSSASAPSSSTVGQSSSLPSPSGG